MPNLVDRFVKDPHHGPLPAMLLVLTVVTGIVDAVTILALGRVFVANMTGNVVFSGLALSGASGFSLRASVTALAAFLVGAACGGGFVRRHRGGRARLLRTAAGLECVLLAACAITVAVSAAETGSAAHSPGAETVAIALAAVALGLQNAVVRALKIPDLTTTVLTLTLTGLAADGADRAATIRRVGSLATMFAGAVVGAVLVLDGHVALALSLAAAGPALVAIWLTVRLRQPQPWQHAR